MSQDSDFMRRFFRDFKKYEWSPQADITTFEMAQCLPAAACCHIPSKFVEDFIEALPIECRRHFKESTSEA